MNDDRRNSAVKVFKEEDFDAIYGADVRQTAADIATVANHILARKLGPRVYKQPGFCGHSWQENKHDASNATHTAYLFDVQELKKEQDTAESLLREVLDYSVSHVLDHGKFRDICQRAKRLLGKEAGE